MHLFIAIARPDYGKFQIFCCTHSSGFEAFGRDDVKKGADIEWILRDKFAHCEVLPRVYSLPAVCWLTNKNGNTLMPNIELPTGQRFSLLYLLSDETLSDCPRMRRRIGTLVDNSLNGNDVEAGQYLEAELGVSVVVSGGYHPYVNWPNFFVNVALEDALDAITLIYNFGINEMSSHVFRNFPAHVERIFRERNMRYRVDEACGVHPHVDIAFELARASSIAGLSAERFNAAKAHLEGVENAMMGSEPDNRQAIRSIFDAVENIFKMMFTGVTHVNSAAIISKLRPKVEETFVDHQMVKRAFLKQVDGFKNWVEAAHFYRHADGQPEPAQPPNDFSVLMISQGYGWVRWLASLDQRQSDNNE